jgi:hypothetical protein
VSRLEECRPPLRRHIYRHGGRGLAAAATIALVGEIPLARLQEAVPAFPTRSEVWLRLLERWSAHTPSA